MNKICTALIFIFLIYLPTAKANTCKIEDYVVGFFNGVQTDPTAAQGNLKALNLATQTNSFNGESVEYKRFYNSSLKGQDIASVFYDFSENFFQRSLEFGVKAKYEWFHAYTKQQVHAGMAAKIAELSEGLASWLDNTFYQLRDATYATILGMIGGGISGLNSDYRDDITRHELQNDTYMWEGKKLIYVAHSQGNLWVNQSYNYVIDSKGYSSDNIIIIHVAPASVLL